MCRSIIETVIRNCNKRPDVLAIAYMNQAYSYQELVNAVGQVAKWYDVEGMKAGEYLLVECTQDAAFVILDLACQLQGIIFVPLEKKATKERVADIYKETQARFIIGETDYSDIGSTYKTSEIMGGIDVSIKSTYQYNQVTSVAEILFSTGTTGQPKGIVISNAANVAIAENISKGVEMKEGAVELIPLPLSHSHGLRTCYANFLNGSAVVIADGVMNVGLLFELMDRYDVNAIDISPTLAKILLKIAKKGLIERAERIDYIEIGTAVLEDDTKKKLMEIYKKSRLYNFYGSTEAGRSCVLDFNEFDDTGCIGYPSQNATFYFTDDDRNFIESNKENPGLIAVSGSMMMDEYLNSEELTKQTLIDGIIYSNDLGYMDSEGRIYVLGRKDDIINYKGIKIAPEEIEHVAIKYEGVTDCACVPVADKICGQAPKLFISIEANGEKAPNFEQKEFIAFLKENLEQSRIPTVVEVIDRIPRSSNGKLQRKKLSVTE